MATKPSPHASLAGLDVEAAGDGYVFDLGKPHGTITFPDPEDLSLEAAEALMQAIESPTAPVSDSFRAWLSAEDFEKFTAAKLRLREVVALSRLLGEHYKEFFGTAGND